MFNEYLRSIMKASSPREIDDLVSKAAMDHDISDDDWETLNSIASGQKLRFSAPPFERKMISILIGFERKEDGKVVEDETSFDIEVKEDGQFDIIQLLELWGTFCCENDFCNVEISYMEGSPCDNSSC